jgi:hypothetical protein
MGTLVPSGRRVIDNVTPIDPYVVKFPAMYGDILTNGKPWGVNWDFDRRKPI